MPIPAFSAAHLRLAAISSRAASVLGRIIAASGHAMRTFPKPKSDGASTSELAYLCQRRVYLIEEVRSRSKSHRATCSARRELVSVTARLVAWGQ
jgi:hypothetical protein